MMRWKKPFKIAKKNIKIAKNAKNFQNAMMQKFAKKIAIFLKIARFSGGTVRHHKN